MAVIDISMDKPKSCVECSSYQGVNGCCDKGCFLPYSLFDNGDAVPQDCPLKSTDEMIAEIESVPDVSPITDGNVTYGYQTKAASVYKKEIMEVIHKYCDK